MENLKWYDHIELAGFFLIGVYIVGTICKTVIDKWIGTLSCKSCAAMIAVTAIPEIQKKQAELRQQDLPEIRTDIAVIKNTLQDMDDKLGMLIEETKKKHGY